MHDPGSDDYCLASMGIYVFNAKTLIDALATDTTDFGKEIIPGLLGKEKMCSYVFDEYWEDIGTVKAFFDTNLSLTDALPPFNFFDEDAKIYTRARLLPASKLNSCNVDRAVVADGCIVTNGTLTRCSLGVRSVVHNGAKLENVIMMGADSYETADDLEENVAAARPDIGVGEGSVVRHAILDKNVRIGKHVVLDPTGLPDRFGEGIDLAIRDGVLVVCKNVVVPDGFVLNA
jgi:glucose-1-phosphate adenylyltransferase